MLIEMLKTLFILQLFKVRRIGLDLSGKYRILSWEKTLFITMLFLFFAVALLKQNVHAATWETSVVGTASASTRPVICSDLLGHQHVAWTSDDIYGGIVHYATDQSGLWSYQKQVAGSSYDAAYVPLITTDTHGFAYIVARFSSSYFRIKYATNKEITSNYWDIVTQMWDAHYHETSIEVDTDKNVHIFAQEDTYGSNVYYQHLDADSIVIPNITQFYGTAIDQNDNLHFVGFNDAGIYYTSYDGSSWSATDTIDQGVVDAYLPSITCGNDGVLHVAFTSPSGIYYLNNESGSWGTPELTGGAGIFPNVVVDENGCAHIAYYTQVENGQMYYLNNIGGSWNTGEYICTINTDGSPATMDAAHVRSKIALDLKSSTVNIVYITDGDDVTVAQTDDYELRSSKSTDVSSTLVSTAPAPVTNTLPITTTGEFTLQQFTISDIGGDGEPTKIQEFVFQRGPEMSDDICFNDFFQSMTLEVSGESNISCTIYASKILAGTPGSVIKSIPEGGSLSFILKGTLNNPLEGVVDNSVQVKLNGLYDVIIDQSGSYFAYNCVDVCSDILLFELNGFPGSGTIGDPYQIADIDDLQVLSEYNAYWESYFIQTANIDASATSSWNSGDGFSPIGGPSNAFSGSYDGDGHTIDGLTINRGSTSYVGLFGSTSNVTIEDLGVINTNITGNWSVGGLVGWAINDTVSDCYTSGSVAGGNWVGGLVGSASNGTVSTCYSNASVAGSGVRAGGLIGDNLNCTISNSYSTGSVSGGSNVGGLVGRNLVATVSNSYSTGDVTRSSGTSTSHAGFCGYTYNSTIEYCYSIGSVIYDGEDPIDKGFLGVEFGTNTYTSNFFDKNTSGQTAETQAVPAAATGKTTEEMKNGDGSNSITDWGWSTDVWERIGYNYPRLVDNPDPTLPVTLSTFSATFHDNKVLIQWTTATETDVQGFNVFRSENQDLSEVGDHINVSIIPGEGTTTEPHDYLFVDEVANPFNTYYYWLQVVDFGGECHYHGPQKYTPGDIDGDNQIDSYSVNKLFPSKPNPCSQQVSIDYKLKGSVLNQRAEIVIYNIRGQIIRRVQGTQGNATIDVSDLKTGVYFYQLKETGFNQIKKMIIIQ